jgi:hypothetical protein
MRSANPIRFFVEVGYVFLFGTVLTIPILGFFPLGIVVVFAAVLVREIPSSGPGSRTPVTARPWAKYLQSLCQRQRSRRLVPQPQGHAVTRSFLADLFPGTRRLPHPYSLVHERKSHVNQN